MLGQGSISLDAPINRPSNRVTGVQSLWLPCMQSLLLGRNGQVGGGEYIINVLIRPIASRISFLSLQD